MFAKNKLVNTVIMVAKSVLVVEPFLDDQFRASKFLAGNSKLYKFTKFGTFNINVTQPLTISLYRYSDIYKCTKGGRCQITLKTRKNCQFCRFQACEKAGMKRSWVLADGEVKSKKVASSSVGGCVPSSNKVTSTTNLSAIMPSSSSSNTNIMCSILSPQDEGKIRNCIEKMQLIKQQTEDLNPQVCN